MRRWSWLGDRLALDFANTVRRRGDHYVEYLATPDDLRDWLAAEAGRVPPVDTHDAGAFPAVRALRDDVLGLLRAAARGEPWPADAVDRVNDALLRHPVVRLLHTADTPAELRLAGDGPAPSALLATLAAAVVDLLAGPDGRRLALCDAPGCGQLYLRERANQRWCGNACGTRARVVRHQKRVTRTP
ncbi:CGNR zinc finger domain-containing protein [Jiangella anatolica]|uniref:Zinc finger CGNR domain-containing protein n=1 Tax=Jiangella anatolica TaxID=2670374 RepID=A0A2W2BZK7_9ACTN|nr:ABATE domain-containing protein [Jiangella anatolica]PZF81107.1 hypothetical protein C1I92_22665 [Jiangella anatolica]